MSKKSSHRSGAAGFQAVQAAALANQQARQLFEEAVPLREEVLRQIQEALTTGGVGAQIPIAQRAVEAALLGQSAATDATRDSLARAGLTGTPFAEQILASLRLQGGIAAREAELGPARNMINLAPQLAAGLSGIGFAGLGPMAGGVGDLGQQAIQGSLGEQQLLQNYIFGGAKALPQAMLGAILGGGLLQAAGSGAAASGGLGSGLGFSLPFGK